MSVRAQAEEHRSPPSNLAAEQALLGALLVNNEAIHLVATFLQPEHLFLPVHGRIYDAVMQMVARREIANPVTLKTYFENEEALKEAGGGQYLARLADSAVTVVNAGTTAAPSTICTCAVRSSILPRTYGTPATTRRLTSPRENRSRAWSRSSTGSSKTRRERGPKCVRSVLNSATSMRSARQRSSSSTCRCTSTTPAAKLPAASSARPADSSARAGSDF